MQSSLLLWLTCKPNCSAADTDGAIVRDLYMSQHASKFVWIHVLDLILSLPVFPLPTSNDLHGSQYESSPCLHELVLLQIWNRSGIGCICETAGEHRFGKHISTENPHGNSLRTPVWMSRSSTGARCCMSAHSLLYLC